MQMSSKDHEWTYTLVCMCERAIVQNEPFFA